MRNFTSRLTNSVEPANWKAITLSHLGNSTTNAVILPAIFNRECAEYDAGTLPFEHDLYLGERCG